MALHDFIARLINRAGNGDDRTPIVTNHPYGLKWPELFLIKRTTKVIDFMCEFENGTCRCYRRKQYDVRTGSCCDACWKNAGYLKVLPKNDTLLRYYGQRFLPEVGFWREGKGCILPRQFRSIVCVRYNCDSRSRLKENNSPTVIRLLDLLENLQTPNPAIKSELGKMALAAAQAVLIEIRLKRRMIHADEETDGERDQKTFIKGI